MTRLGLRGALLASALTLLGGCAGEEWAPYGRLTSLRILAIQSDPVAPAPGESTTLTPLLYVPSDQGDPELTWSWCPVPGPEDDGYPCLFSVEDMAEMAGHDGLPAQLPDFEPELGTGPTMAFVNALPGELLSGLCLGMGHGAGNAQPATPGAGDEELRAAALSACPHGFPVQIKLRAKTDREEVVAVRTLHLGFDPLHGGNTIPSLPGAELRVDGEWTPISPEFAGPVERDRKNALRALVPVDQAESYAVRDADGEASERERLTISWFVESGNTKSERTGFIEGVAPIEVLNENEWYPDLEEDYPRTTAELVLVLRDNREGVSWWRHTFDVAEEP